MKEMTLTYPDDLEEAVQLTAEEMPAQIRLMAALKMFELGQLSSGKAAELAVKLNRTAQDWNKNNFAQSRKVSPSPPRVCAFASLCAFARNGFPSSLY